jgi:hypothetical protein
VQNHQLNLSYFSQKVEKRSSPIEGRGLFAKRAIKMGEVVVVKGGYILTRTQRDRRELASSKRAQLEVKSHFQEPIREAGGRADCLVYCTDT